MSFLTRRTFISLVLAAALIAIFSGESSAQLKGFRIHSPINDYTYVWFGGTDCRIKYRRTQNSLRVLEVRYTVDGNFIGTGTPNLINSYQYPYFWSSPIPAGGVVYEYVLRADAIQVGTGNVIATDTVRFRVMGLQGLADSPSTFLKH